MILKQENINKRPDINTIFNKESQIKEVLNSSFTSYYNLCITDTGNKIYCEEGAKRTQEKLRICFSKYSVNKFSIEEILKRCSLDYLEERALEKCITGNIFNKNNKKKLEYICDIYAKCLVRHYERGNQLDKANDICLEELRQKNLMKE